MTQDSHNSDNLGASEKAHFDIFDCGPSPADSMDASERDAQIRKSFAACFRVFPLPENFFDIGAGGGTHFAPAMAEAWRIMMEQPSTVGKSDWDRYMFHVTDGEPQLAEGESLLALLERLRGTPSGYVGYVECGLLDGFSVGQEGALNVILLDEVEPPHEFKKD